MVPLRLHQIHYLENGEFNPDLSNALVFVEDGLRKLKNRMKELQQEKIDIKKNHKELRRGHVGLVKSRKEKQARVWHLRIMKRLARRAGTKSSRCPDAQVWQSY